MQTALTASAVHTFEVRLPHVKRLPVVLQIFRVGFHPPLREETQVE